MREVDRTLTNEAFPGYGFRQGSYVDLALVNKVACATQTPYYRQLIEAFRQYAMPHRTYDLMHVGFELRPTVSASAAWWTMGAWIYRIGRNEAEAKRWQEAVESLQTFLLTLTDLAQLRLPRCHEVPQTRQTACS